MYTFVIHFFKFLYLEVRDSQVKSSSTGRIESPLWSPRTIYPEYLLQY